MKQAYDFLICLAAMMLGIYLEYTCPLGLSTTGYLGIWACCLIGLSLTKISQNIRLFSGSIFCLVIGSLAFAINAKQLKNSQIDLAGQYQYLVGIVRDIQLLQHPLYREQLSIALESGKLSKFFKGTRLKSQISAYSKTLTSASIGDKILIKFVAIKPPTKHITATDLSLAKTGSCATVFLSNKYQYKILEYATDHLRAKIWQMRQKIYNKIIDHLSSQAAAYIGLLFFGNKQHKDTVELQDIFSYWGLSHYLARSGLHIVLLIAMWLILLRFIPVNIRLKNVFFSFFVLIYTACSWESTSFLRALFVFLFTQSGLWIGRETQALHLLTIICMGMILYNPFLIFYLDFQLTFGLTLGLLAFSKNLVH